MLASEVRAVLGRLAYFRGDIAAAGERYRQAIAAQRELGADRFLAIGGDHDVARLGHPGQGFAIVIILVYLAWVAGWRSAHGRAARLLSAVSRIRDEVGGGPTRDTIPVWLEAEDEARRALGDEAFEEIRAEGYAMSMEEAVASGLEG